MSTEYLTTLTESTRKHVNNFLTRGDDLDWLFGRNSLFDTIQCNLEEMRAISRSSWAKSTGAKEEIYWIVKDRAEAMVNVMTLQRVVMTSFLDDLSTIEACLKLL